MKFVFSNKDRLRSIFIFLVLTIGVLSYQNCAQPFETSDNYDKYKSILQGNRAPSNSGETTEASSSGTDDRSQPESSFPLDTTIRPPLEKMKMTDKTVLVDTTVTFFALIDYAKSFKWYRDDVLISTCQSSQCSITESNAGVFKIKVVASNKAGFVVSQAILKVQDIPAVLMAPVLTSEPQSIIVNVGEKISLSVSAIGNPIPTYQWRYNNSNLPGANGNTLELLNASASNAGNYTVVVSNSQGVILSQVAKVTVRQSCTLPSSLGGGNLSIGAFITTYKASEVIAPAKCESEIRSCNDVNQDYIGELTGSFAYRSCEVKTVQTASCPAGFIKVPVPSNNKVFCVAKYEMTKSGVSQTTANNTTYRNTDVPVSMPEYRPWTNLTKAQAISECQSMGANYDLISNDQWNLIASDIANNSQNWFQGKLESTSFINQGRSATYFPDGSTPEGIYNVALAPSSDDIKACGAGQPCNVSDKESFRVKRTHTLSNGNIIWDFSGNSWEIVKDKDSSSLTRTTNYVDVNSSVNNVFTYLAFFPQNLLSSSVSSVQSCNTCGFGKMGVDGVGSNIIRGGAANKAEKYYIAGIFTGKTKFSDAPYSHVGFRCVYLLE